MRLALTSAFAIALAVPFTAAATAQNYPSRTVTVVVPFPAGGSVDGVARILVQKLNETMGQHFIVENRAGGASGIVGANAVAKAAPDGYTLLVSASVHVINPFLYKSVPYDVVHDFTPVTLLAEGPLIVSTTPSVPANNLKDFFAQRPAEIHLRRHHHRLRRPSRYRAAQARRRPRHPGDHLQRHCAGAHRSHERADSAARRPHALLATAGTSRQDQGARPHQPQTRSGGARHSNRGRVRRERLRVRVVVRIVGSEEPAGRSFQYAADAHRQGAGAAGREAALERAWIRADRVGRERVRELHSRGNGEMRENHPRRKDQSRVSAVAPCG